MLTRAAGPRSLDDVRVLDREEEGGSWPLLLWTPGPGNRMISSAVLGGGLGERHWVLNAQVRPGYARTDSERHLSELAAQAGATGPGVGLMTAASVRNARSAVDGEAQALVTAGIGVHGWAAAPGIGSAAPLPAGTINIIVAVPVPLTDAALVNAVATATEAKVQALRDAGVDASGTPTDAVCVAARDPSLGPPGAVESFAGPRSRWGARMARAVHRATYLACLPSDAAR
ncbi:MULTISPECIES: adenosylcobinamide amidohydrolase [unclassified Streptomyces]|uniref:adenosylcobinamide amidohydrolase n=1 Tax=unclassified Streptomyces TaxID=2593676 RepID=UPI0035ABE6C8